MRTLSRTVGRESIGGEPLPSCFTTFERLKVVIRRSELTMIAGVPGVGKSFLSLALALKTGVPTLYFSADTNAHTMAVRIASMISGKNQDETEHLLATDPGWTKITLERGKHIQWCFDSSPSLGEVADEVKAFTELWGCPPSMIVVDNLMDIATEGGEEYATMKAITKELKILARDTNSAVILLHHTSESIPGSPCQPRSSLLGKISQVPALVLTLGVNGNRMASAVVKNRYGEADALGVGVMAWLDFFPAYAYLNDISVA